MALNSVKVWAVGISILCVALLLGTVLLGAKPKFDEVAEMNSEREDVEFLNQKLQAEVDKLRKMEDELPQTREDIAALQIGIPTTMNMDQLLIHIGELASDHDLAVSGSSSELPVSFIENAPEPELDETEAPAPADGTGDEPEPVAPGEVEEESGPATTTERSPEGLDLLQEFYILDLEVTVQGTYADAIDFIQELQVDSTRHFLVSEVELVGFVEEQDGTNGLPDAEVGDVTLRVKGSAYVLEGIIQPEDPDAEPTKEPKMPKPGGNDNPFVPIEGQPAS